MKVALNRMALELTGMKSRLILTVHDEAILEVHESELQTVPQMAKQIMVEAFPTTYLPMAAEISYGRRSLADLTETF